MKHCMTKTRRFTAGYLRGYMTSSYGNREDLYPQKAVERRQISNLYLYYDQS